MYELVPMESDAVRSSEIKPKNPGNLFKIYRLFIAAGCRAAGWQSFPSIII